MEELAEVFRLMKLRSKELKLAKQKETVLWLDAIAAFRPDEIRQLSAYHYRLQHGTLVVDVWPTTGKFWVHKSPHSKAGLEAFLDLLAHHDRDRRSSPADAGHSVEEVPAAAPILQPVRTGSGPGFDPGFDPSMPPF